MSAVAGPLPGAGAPPETAERCDRCGAALEARHEHLVDPARRAVACACGVCAVVASGLATSPWKRVRPHATRLPDLELADGEWDALGVPVGLAFFVGSSRAGGVVAGYPGAAGVVEAEVRRDTWAALAARHPALATLASDVEALLVNRARGAREYWHVSIDECYRLAGLIRTHWRGFTGGAAVWREIDGFFAGLGSAG